LAAFVEGERLDFVSSAGEQAEGGPEAVTRKPGLWPAFTTSIICVTGSRHKRMAVTWRRRASRPSCRWRVFEAGGHFAERHGGSADGAERGAEGHASEGEGEGEAFAGDIGENDHKAAIGEGDDVDVIATDFVTSGGRDGDGVAGEVREGLREEVALDGAGGVEIELDAFPFEGAFVVLGVADGECGLESNALEGVAFF